jgi:hypothetical protein
MALLNFKVSEAEPMAPMGPVPAGEYLVCVSDSDMKPTKSGSGQYLQLTFSILQGEHKNRKVYARLNLVNDNVTAVKIAKSELAAICQAVGVAEIKDSAQLHNKPLVVKVEVREYNGKESNEIRGYRASKGAVMPAGVVPEPVAKPVADEDLPF